MNMRHSKMYFVFSLATSALIGSYSYRWVHNGLFSILADQGLLLWAIASLAILTLACMRKRAPAGRTSSLQLLLMVVCYQAVSHGRLPSSAWTIHFYFYGLVVTHLCAWFDMRTAYTTAWVLFALPQALYIDCMAAAREGSGPLSLLRVALRVVGLAGLGLLNSCLVMGMPRQVVASAFTPQRSKAAVAELNSSGPAPAIARVYTTVFRRMADVVSAARGYALAAAIAWSSFSLLGDGWKRHHIGVQAILSAVYLVGIMVHTLQEQYKHHAAQLSAAKILLQDLLPDHIVNKLLQAAPGGTPLTPEQMATHRWYLRKLRMQSRGTSLYGQRPGSMTGGGSAPRGPFRGHAAQGQLGAEQPSERPSTAAVGVLAFLRSRAAAPVAEQSPANRRQRRWSDGTRPPPSLATLPVVAEPVGGAGTGTSGSSNGAGSGSRSGSSGRRIGMAVGGRRRRRVQVAAVHASAPGLALGRAGALRGAFVTADGIASGSLAGASTSVSALAQDLDPGASPGSGGRRGAGAGEGLAARVDRPRVDIGGAASRADKAAPDGAAGSWSWAASPAGTLPPRTPTLSTTPRQESDQREKLQVHWAADEAAPTPSRRTESGSTAAASSGRYSMEWGDQDLWQPSGGPGLMLVRKGSARSPPHQPGKQGGGQPGGRPFEDDTSFGDNDAWQRTSEPGLGSPTARQEELHTVLGVARRQSTGSSTVAVAAASMAANNRNPSGSRDPSKQQQIRPATPHAPASAFPSNMMGFGLPPQGGQEREARGGPLLVPTHGQGSIVRVSPFALAHGQVASASTSPFADAQVQGTSSSAPSLSFSQGHGAGASDQPASHPPQVRHGSTISPSFPPGHQGTSVRTPAPHPPGTTIIAAAQISPPGVDGAASPFSAPGASPAASSRFPPAVHASAASHFPPVHGGGPPGGPRVTVGRLSYPGSRQPPWGEEEEDAGSGGSTAGADLLSVPFSAAGLLPLSHAVTSSGVAEWHDSASVLFADVVGFTAMSAAALPHQVMSMLDELYCRFDTLAEYHGVYKVETIGDCYMAATGLPLADPDHAQRLVAFARDMLLEARRVAMPVMGGHVNIRVGAHSGRVLAGLVGRIRRQYRLFGDTVNTASRMESTSLPCRIQISAAMHHQLRHCRDFEWECRGEQDIKGRGLMTTYLLRS